MRTNETEDTSNRLLRCFQRYFGYGRPGLTRHQRWRIFLANEQRSWNRLLGRSSGTSCLEGAGPDPPDTALS